MSMHLREAYESQSSSQPSILVCSGAFQRTHHHPLDTAVTVLCELSWGRTVRKLFALLTQRPNRRKGTGLHSLFHVFQGPIPIQNLCGKQGRGVVRSREHGREFGSVSTRARARARGTIPAK
jgi:hypothetical protein